MRPAAAAATGKISSMPSTAAPDSPRNPSAAGHNGMESVIERVSLEEIPRLRIGISQGQPPLDYSAYVLEDFEEREGEIVEEVLERSSQAVNTILSDGLERAMALYN